MRQLFSCFISCAILLSATSVWAYPYFFTCNADRSISNVVPPAEQQRLLRTLLDDLAGIGNESEQIARIGELCRAGGTCLEGLERLMNLATDVGDAIGEYATAEFRAAQARARELISEARSRARASRDPVVSVPAQLAQLVDGQANLAEQVALLTECRTLSTSLPAEALTPDDRCLLFNPHHSPYMYPTGLRDNAHESYLGDVSDTEMVSCRALTNLIDAAVATGENPQTAVAISLMESGTDVADLYLDPIGSIIALGCNRPGPGRATRSTYTSFMNTHTGYMGVVNSPNLLNHLATYQQSKNHTPRPGQSFYCANTGQQGRGRVVASAAPGACCLSLPYAADSVEAGDVDIALTMSSFSRYFSAPLSTDEANGRTDALELSARRLQRYNGFTRAMGGGEPLFLSPWRAGVDFTETPAYGYQAMDFLLNTVMTNPFINARIAAAQVRFNRPPAPSPLCTDRAPGSYMIDSNEYFNRVRNSPRMPALLERWRSQGRTWAGLRFPEAPGRSGNPNRYQRVLLQEFRAVYESNRYPEFNQRAQSFYDALELKLVNNVHFDMDRLVAEMEQVPGVNLDELTRIYFESVLPERDTIGEANQMDQFFSWRAEMDSREFDSLRRVHRERLGLDRTSGSSAPATPSETSPDEAPANTEQ